MMSHVYIVNSRDFGRWSLLNRIAGQHGEEGGWLIYTNDRSEYENLLIAELEPCAEHHAVKIASADALAAALRAVIEHHDTWIAAVLGADYQVRYGDPAAIAEARKVLAELNA
jgi:hypothetical protein